VEQDYIEHALKAEFTLFL